MGRGPLRVLTVGTLTFAGWGHDMQAVIFDMDGLMINSEPLQLRAINRALEEVGLCLTEADWMDCVGRKSFEVIRELHAEHGFKQTPESVEQAKVAGYRQLVREPGALQLMPGLHEAVAASRSAGLKIAIASSSVRRDIAIIVEITGLEGVFDVITAGDEVTVGKPDPAIFLEAARRLGVAPQTCLVLEDSPHGITAARAAGMFSVAVPNRFTAHQDFSQADRVLNGLSDFALELPLLLSQWDGSSA